MFSSDVKPSVFVSAVSADLRTTRDAASRVLNTLGCLPVEQQRFPVNAYVDVRQMLEKKLRSCQAVVHIAGERYGYEPDVATLPPGTPRRSYTQLEFDLARQLKKPIYVFICGDGYPYDPPRPGIDPLEEPAELRELQQAHRAALMADGGVYHEVSTGNDVEHRVCELETRLDVLRRQLERGRLMMIVAAVVLALGLFGVIYQLSHTRQDVAGVAADLAASRQLLEQWLKNQGEMNALAQGGDGATRRSIRDLSDEEYYAGLARRAHSTPEQVKTLLAQLQNSHDLSTRAKVALVERQFSDAERLFDEAKQERLRQATPAIIGIAEDELGQSQAFYYQQNYVRALELLASATKRIDGLPDGHKAARQLWGQIQFWTADVELARLPSLDGKELHEATARAVAACRRALEVQTRETLPQDWAATEDRLGAALWGEANLVSGPKREKLLTDAIEAFRRALGVYTREALPENWAMTENNLGIALRSQAQLIPGAGRPKLLAEAVAVFRCALEVYTGAPRQADWADVQNNLGVALQDQAELFSGPERANQLAEAVAAFRSAVKVHTRASFPREWAGTQQNLGTAFRDQAVLKSGPERIKLLEESVATYRSALEIRTRESLPRDWAQTQSSLGIALTYGALLAPGPAQSKLLDESIAAYRSALEVQTRESLPDDSARTQNNLGNALRYQAELASGTVRATLLNDAIVAYHSALEIITRGALPREWAVIENSLGVALQDQAELFSGQNRAKLLAEAVVAYRSALEICTREAAPQNWARIQDSLGFVLSMQAKLVSGSERPNLLAEAVDAYRCVLEIRTREASAEDWASAEYTLGITLREQAGVVPSAHRAKLLAEAEAALRSALVIRTRESQPQRWADTQCSLAYAIWNHAETREGEDRLKLLREAVELFGEVAQAPSGGDGSTHQKAFYASVFVLSELLGDTARAADSIRTWLKSHPDDLEATLDLTELTFTSARFEECLTQLDALHPKLIAAKNPQLDLVRAALQALVLTMLDKPADAKKQLQELHASLLDQGDDFSLGWTWTGTKNFIEHSADERVAKHRERLLAIVEAISQPTKKAILEKLKPLAE